MLKRRPTASSLTSLGLRPYLWWTSWASTGTLKGIKAGFRKLGTIVEIDPECLLDDDYSTLRVVIARVKPDDIPEDL